MKQSFLLMKNLQMCDRDSCALCYKRIVFSCVCNKRFKIDTEHGFFKIVVNFITNFFTLNVLIRTLKHFLLGVKQINKNLSSNGTEPHDKSYK